LEIQLRTSDFEIMDNRTGAIRIRMVIAMIAIAKPIANVIHLPGLRLPRLFGAARRRRQATIDLIHASPHLLRDIGATEDNVGGHRRR
jgi:uncharacterized protein YjiS (DUF1127 family)